MESRLLKLQVNDEKKLICNEFHPKLLFLIFQMNCFPFSSVRFDLNCLQEDLRD